MMPGPTEIIVIFMMTLGFGVEQDKTAPTAAEIHQYAVSDAEYTLYMNARAVIPPSLAKVNDLVKKPLVRDVIGEAMANQIGPQIEMARQAAKAAIGIDPVTDVHWAAMWVDIRKDNEPSLLICAKGNWPDGLLNTIQKQNNGTLDTVNGQQVLKTPKGDAWIALASNGVLIAGHADLVKARLAPTWTPSP